MIMKVTKAQLIQVIKEELMREQGDEQLYDLLKGERPPPQSTGQYSLRDPGAASPPPAEEDIRDAIQMLEAEEDVTGTLFHVINRLYEALEKL